MRWDIREKKPARCLIEPQGHNDHIPQNRNHSKVPTVTLNKLQQLFNMPVCLILFCLRAEKLTFEIQAPGTKCEHCHAVGKDRWVHNKGDTCGECKKVVVTGVDQTK
jgi:hypothetical protein